MQTPNVQDIARIRDEVFTEALAMVSSCEPADRGRAENAFADLYRLAGEDPVPVLWLGSPIALGILIKQPWFKDHRGFSAKFRLLSDHASESLLNFCDKKSLSRIIAPDSRKQEIQRIQENQLHHIDDRAVGVNQAVSLQRSKTSAALLWRRILRAVGLEPITDSPSFDHAMRTDVYHNLLSAVGEFSSITSDITNTLKSDLKYISLPKGKDFERAPCRSHCGGNLGILNLVDSEIASRMKLSDDRSKIARVQKAWWDIAASCGPYIPLKNVVIATERPVYFYADEERGVHCETGPAFLYRDGWSGYMLYDQRTVYEIVEKPEVITLKDIMSRDLESEQRFMIDRYGWDRLAQSSEVKIVDDDPKYGRLYSFLCELREILFVEVTNGSPEPDGTYRKYYLPVADNCALLVESEEGIGYELGAPQRRTALNAVASTYGLTGEEYKSIRMRT